MRSKELAEAAINITSNTLSAWSMWSGTQHPVIKFAFIAAVVILDYFIADGVGS